MIDLDVVFRSYLLSDPAPTTRAGKEGYAGVPLATLVADRVYAGVDLPTGYSPVPVDGNEDSGSAVLFNARGGPGSSGTAPLLYPTIQVRSYGANEGEARALDRAVFDHLDGAQTRDIRSCWLAIAGQLARESEPRSWPYVLTTYRAVTLAD